MTPKEEAEKLVGMFERQITKGDVDGEWVTDHLIKYFYYTAKQCALIAVNRIMKAGIHPLDLLYWEEVKKEIEKI